MAESLESDVTDEPPYIVQLSKMRNFVSNENRIGRLLTLELLKPTLACRI